MTLERLLEIDRQFLSSEHDLALRFSEGKFIAAGCPSHKHRLIDFLEEILIACKREGLLYPPIFLLRKKQLQRGIWAPKMPRMARSDADQESRIAELKSQAAQILGGQWIEGQKH